MTVAVEPSGTQRNAARSRSGRGGGRLARLAGLAAATGVLLVSVFASPQAAFAQGDFTAAINNGDQWIDVGGAAVNISVTLTATHSDPAGKDGDVEASLDGIGDYAWIGVVDGGGCTVTGDASVKCENVEMNGQRTITFSVNPYAESDLPEGEQKVGQFKVKYNGGDTSTNVTVVGNAQTQTVTTISGTVTSNGDLVAGAKVVLKDGGGTEHETETGDDGVYTFDGSGSEPITPGEMTLTVTKDGFEDQEETFEVQNGSSYSRNVTLTVEEVEETTSAAATTEAATSAAETTQAEDGGGGVSGTLVFLIVIGALLVVGGIVGIVFLLRGGKDDDKDDDDDFGPEGPPEHTPTAAQVGSPGVYQAGPAPGSDAPTMIHPGGLVDSAVGNPAAPTQFGPAYGGAGDSTQVMPQGGFGASPQVGPDGTTILPVVKQPGGPGGDATQIMPQANLSAPPSPYGGDLGATRPHPAPTGAFDPNATRPHPGASPASGPYSVPERPSPSPYGDPAATRPHPAPTPPPGGGMFEPQNPGLLSGQSEPRYGAPSAPQSGSSPYGGPSASQQGYGAPGAPQGDHYTSSQSMRRDPYAPQDQPPPPTGEYGGTRAMPQQYGDQSQPPAPYGGEQQRDDENPDSRRTDRRGWGEWDDRPRSW